MSPSDLHPGEPPIDLVPRGQEVVGVLHLILQELRRSEDAARDDAQEPSAWISLVEALVDRAELAKSPRERVMVWTAIAALAFRVIASTVRKARIDLGATKDPG